LVNERQNLSHIIQTKIPTGPPLRPREGLLKQSQGFPDILRQGVEENDLGRTTAARSAGTRTQLPAAGMVRDIAVMCHRDRFRSPTFRDA
jgi:hypothetical protein